MVCSSIALFIMKFDLACRQDDDAMRSSLESLQLSDAMHLCSVTMEQVSVNQTQLVAATLSELVPIRAAYLQAFSSQQRVAFHSRYRIGRGPKRLCLLPNPFEFINKICLN